MRTILMRIYGYLGPFCFRLANPAAAICLAAALTSPPTTVTTNRHHQPPSPPTTVTTNRHHQPSPPTVTTNRHHQPSPPTTVTTNQHHQPTFSGRSLVTPFCSFFRRCAITSAATRNRSVFPDPSTIKDPAGRTLPPPRTFSFCVRVSRVSNQRNPHKKLSQKFTRRGANITNLDCFQYNPAYPALAPTVYRTHRYSFPVASNGQHARHIPKRNITQVRH